MWDLATGEHTLDGLVAVLAEHFAIGPEEIRSDIAAIIREFADAGLLQSPAPTDAE